jgi:hypothetical protein
MFFRKWRERKEKEKRCLAYFLKNKHLVEVHDLNRVKFIGEHPDSRPYVGTVGFFEDDTFSLNIPKLTWYCRKDGNIWAAWYYVPEIGAPYNTNAYVSALKSKNNGSVKYNAEMIPMSEESKQIVNKFTHEQWTMHKLGSYTLL